MHIHKPHTHSSQTHKPPLRYMPFPLCTFTQAHARSTKSSTLLSILFSASVSVSILTPLVCRNFRFQRVLLQWVEERCKLLPGCFFQLLCMSLKWDALKLMCFTVFFTSITSFSLEAIYLFSVCQRMFFVSRGVFACVESCSVQVMGNTHINSHHTVNKATRSRLMSLRSITMKQVTIVYA